MRTRFTLTRLILATSVSALTALTSPSVQAASFSWGGTTNFWSVNSAWVGGTAPTGTNPTDILSFAGDVGFSLYTTTNNIAATPFQVNRINLTATNLASVSGNAHTIKGTALAFVGSAPELVQSGAGAVAFTTPFELDGTFTVSGSGAGLNTANGKVTGIANIVKNGTSTFRFGTPFTAVDPILGPSDNTWLGTLEINAGTVRFNNNEQSGRTAIRSNPIVMNGASAVFSCASEIRCGTISGSFGDIRTVLSTVNTNNPDSESLIITAFTDGDYAGSLTLSPPIGTGSHNGELIVRGTATQTLSGLISIDEDVLIGRGSTLILDNNASLGTQTIGSVTLNGGTIRLENEFTNNDNRIRNATGDLPGASTTLQPVGGGTFILSGNSAGTNEITGRLQLGAAGTTQSNPRSGHLNLQIIHRAGGSADTALTFQNYSREQNVISQFATVNFSATNDNSTPQYVLLGQGVFGPKFLLNGTTPVPLRNELLNTTVGTASVGWATVTGPASGTASVTPTVDFATHTVDGIAPVSTVAWSAALTAVDNARVTSTQATPSGAASFDVNSVKLAPTASGQSLNIAGSGHLNTTAILLSGNNDFTIRSTGGGGISGTATRFFHVDKATLSVEASVAASTQALVKSGQGVLVLSNAANAGLTGTTSINGGTLRATPGSSLPGGEIRFRGGVLEIQGGGTFARNTGAGAGKVNWSGTILPATSDPDDRGSGGFSALGANVTVTLNSGSAIFWEDLGFVRSGHSFTLNSPTGTAMVDFTNPINLTSLANTNDISSLNYNAREIHVLENTNSSTDWARISGVISGTVQNDLLKSGAGTLELTATNTFLGHTQIMEGRLLVTGSTPSGGTSIVSGNATLAGAGSVGTILLNGGSVEPGNNGVGTLTASALYWRTGNMRMDLGTGNQSDTLALGSGKFHKDPQGGAPYEFDFGGTGEGGRTYTFANFGSTSFVAGDFSFINLRTGLDGTFAMTGTALTFTTNLPTATIPTPLADQRINIGGTAAFTVVTGIPGAYTYQWFKNDAPIDGETAATLSFATLNAGNSGSYYVVVSNGTTPVTSNVATLTVNEAPVATPQTVEATEDIAKAIVLAGTDVNSGDTLTYTIVTSPSHGTLSGTPPNITYTPLRNYNGTDSFTFKSRDGLLDSTPATVSINLAAVNDDPVAVTDIVVAGVETNIVSNDTDPDGNTLSLTSVQNGAYGTVTQNGNSVTYTIGAGFTLSDTFTYSISDGNGGTANGIATVRLAHPISFGLAAKNGTVSGEPDGTLLSTASQPGVSADGRVAFIGTETTPDRKKVSALFFGNPPVPVIRLGVTTSPGSALTFGKLSAPVVNAGGDVGFKGSLNKAPAGTADGIWVRSSSGDIRRVAQGKMAVAPLLFPNLQSPVTGITFVSFGDIALPDDGRLIFVAKFKGAPSGFDSGIWRETAMGDIEPVTYEGATIANTTPNIGGVSRVVKTLAIFGPSEKTTLGQRRGFNNGGAVVARVGFVDKSSAIMRFNSDGSKTVLLRTGFSLSQLSGSQIKSFGLPVLADDGGVSVLAQLIPNTGNASATSDIVLIRVSAAGTISRVMQESNPAPNIANSYFTKFSDPVSGDANRVGFIGTLKANLGGVAATNDIGIWRHNAAGTVIEPLAREGTLAPDVNNANFATFKSLAWANDGAAFVATLKGTVKGAISKANDTGLWVEDSTGLLQLAFRNGQSVSFAGGDKTVKTFTVLGPVLGAIGQGGSTNFIGGFAILATFTDKTTGVVTTWVP